MSEIPEDVMEAARAVVDAINMADASAVPTIARAILAERERCAKKVDEYAHRSLVGDGHSYHCYRGLAAAIRGTDAAP